MVQLPGQSCVAIESFLTCEPGQACGLGHVTVVTFDDREFKIQAAQADQTDDVFEADGGATRFPSSDGGLSGVGAFGELLLGEVGAASSFANQVSSV